MKRHVSVLMVAFLLVTLIPSLTHAVDLFGVDVTYGGGTISESASSLPDLVEALVQNEDVFTPLVGNDFTGSLTYFGIPDAVAIQVVGDTQLTITSPLTGLNKTFNGTDRDDLEDQLTDWLLKDGGTEVAKLIQEAAKRSTAAITDGNPSSITAVMADRAFRTFGFYQPSPTMRGSEGGSHIGYWGHVSSSEADTPAGPVDGTGYRFNIPWWWHLGQKLSLVANASGQYKDMEGTEIYGAGLDVGLAIRLAIRHTTSNFGWQITPFGSIQGMGTYDGAVGGLVDQFGITNRFEWELANRILIVVANQLSFFQSVKLKIEDVELDPDLDQQVLKNGIMVDMPINDQGSVRINGFFVDSQFLEDAVMDSYQTAGGGVTLGATGNIKLNAYLSYDFADDYEAWNAGLGLCLGH